MRVVVILIAALVTLGLAAFGIVAAQKEAGSTSLLAVAAHMISPAKGTPPAQVAANPAPPAAPRNPVSDTARSTAPTVVAQNNKPSALPAPAPQAASAPAPTAIPACA